jgi:hypothetical protein
MASEYINNRKLEDNIEQFQNAKRTKARCLLVIEDLKDTISRKSVRKAIIKTETEALILFSVAYEQAQSEFKEAESKLAGDFFLLSENLTRYFKFHLIEPDDAIQEGVMICFEKVDRFVATKGKAFNYMTTCVANHYRQLHRTSKNYNELKKKFFTFKQTCETRIIIKNGKETMFFK